MKPNKRKEAAALRELRVNHSYLMSELSRKEERQTMICTRNSRRGLLVRPAVAIKLTVPSDSALGREIIATRDARSQARKPRRRKP